jgi:hypothetical protein
LLKCADACDQGTGDLVYELLMAIGRLRALPA